MPRIRARSDARYTYFILVTATGGKKRYLEGMEAGADDFITKPVDMDELRARLKGAERMLGLRHHVQQLEGLLPICAYCKRIRDGSENWESIERYVEARSEAQFSHGYCPECYENMCGHKLTTPRLVGQRSAAWLFTFTQEWPLGTQSHQLSYTVPFLRTESPLRSTGFGDAALNYRYQLLPATQRVAVSPRVSLLLPTGSRTRGLGTGDVGAQLNLPVSVTLGSALVSHWNAGLTAVSRGASDRRLCT